MYITCLDLEGVLSTGNLDRIRRGQRHPGAYSAPPAMSRTTTS